MELSVYHVDAFTEELFKGNPAAVVPLEGWLPDEKMQAIAFENNLSETAFFTPYQGFFYIRWFTPLKEVNLCGHATLASAHILFNHLDFPVNTITFHSKSGPLNVTRENEKIILDFPACTIHKIEINDELKTVFGTEPVACYVGREDLMFVFENEKTIIELKPNFNRISEINARGIIITSPSLKYDFISRFFAPTVGVNEDPVTGSAHTMLVPYWSNRLKRTNLHSRQVSHRGGDLYCSLNGDRVFIGGKAITYLTGRITI
jgi:PhzF family phenazine biosynthesis protein